MEHTLVRECAGCGQTKQCHTAEYSKLLDTESALRIAELNPGAPRDMRGTCALCDDCIGKTAPGICNWIGWCLGASFLMDVLGICAWGVSLTFLGGMPLGFVMIFLGWIVGLIGAAGGLTKLGAGKASLFFAMFFAWTPIPALILLIRLPQIKRVSWVNQRLKEKAGQIIAGIQTKDAQLLAGIADKPADQLTAEEKKLLQEKRRHDARVEAAKEYRQEEADKGSYRGAVFGIVFTLFIAACGLWAYSSGRHMEWLGIDLSTGGFWALIGAFLVYDILAIVFARRKIQRREKARAEKESLSK